MAPSPPIRTHPGETHPNWGRMRRHPAPSLEYLFSPRTSKPIPLDHPSLASRSRVLSQGRAGPAQGGGRSGKSLASFPRRLAPDSKPDDDAWMSAVEPTARYCQKVSVAERPLGRVGFAPTGDRRRSQRTEYVTHSSCIITGVDLRTRYRGQEGITTGVARERMTSRHHRNSHIIRIVI